VALNIIELEGLINAIERLIDDCQEEVQSGFIRENPEKLCRIALHFRAQLARTAPIAPRCNAPWVSAVIEPDGAVRPCFFHPPFGSIHDGALIDVLNSDAAVQFRSHLDISNDPICQRCVCSLFLEEGDARRARSGERKARRNFQSDPGANRKDLSRS